MTARIALATAAEFPDLDDDGPALLAALSSLGIAAEPAVWTDPDVDYSRYDLVVVRSTLGLSRAPRRVPRVGRARGRDHNAGQRGAGAGWNTDKTYLRELAALGLPVVETTWLDPGDTFTVPASGEYVVKPAVSAGSRNTNRYVAGDHDDRATRHVRSLLDAGRTVMVQPYLDAIDTAGETALLYFGGEFSHAVRKAPLLELGMPFVTAAFKPESMQPRERRRPSWPRPVGCSTRCRRPAAAVARRDLLYARVDLVPGADGAPTLLELELAEPSMFLTLDGSDGADSAARFAAAIAARVGG